LASCSVGGRALIWDTVTGSLVSALPGHPGRWPSKLTWSPDGTRLSTVGEDGVIRIWDHLTAAPAGEIPGHHQANALAWHPGSTSLATLGGSRQIRVCDPDSGAVLHELGRFDDSQATIAWSPTGEFLAVGDRTLGLRLWAHPGGEFLGRISGDSGTTGICSWSPDGRLIAAVTQLPAGGFEILVWAVSGSAEPRQVAALTNWADALAWSPDSADLALNTAWGGVIIWEVATGRCVEFEARHRHPVHSINWSAAGTHLVTSANDGVTKVSSTETGQTLRTFRDHPDPVWRVAWSPVGQVLALATRTGSVRLWDANRGDFLPLPPVGRLALAPDSGTPLPTRLSCGGAVHTITHHAGRLVAADHTDADLNRERVLLGLSGDQPIGCLAVLLDWATPTPTGRPAPLGPPSEPPPRLPRPLLDQREEIQARRQAGDTVGLAELAAAGLETEER
jgi:WD40 repeat protein